MSPVPLHFINNIRCHYTGLAKVYLTFNNQHKPEMRVKWQRMRTLPTAFAHEMKHLIFSFRSYTS